MEFKWEDISGLTSRAKVFGGWIVHKGSLDRVLKTQSESMVFVPDAKHEWKINQEVKNER